MPDAREDDGPRPPGTAPRPRRRGPLRALLAAMRPKQWTKNLLVFAGLLFTLDQRHTAHDFRRAALGFALFSLLSSVVYLVNDVADRQADRSHPQKCRRPVASGELSVGLALAAAALLGLAGLALSFALRPAFGAVALLYLALTLAYSLHFKHVVLLDVLLLAAGFVLRAVAGAVVIPVSISPWLILCTLMLALFLGLSKRRAEILAVQESGRAGTRRTLDEYSAAMLDQMIVIVTSACLMSYALYTVESPAAARHHYLMLTIPFVLYGIFRYLYLMHRHSLGEAPDAVLLEDRPMLVNLLLFGLATALIVTHAPDALLHLLRR